MGDPVGEAVGGVVGDPVGAPVGEPVGALVGGGVGRPVGGEVGSAAVGLGVRVGRMRTGCGDGGFAATVADGALGLAVGAVTFDGGVGFGLFVQGLL